MLPPRNYSRRTRDRRTRSPVHRRYIKTFLCLLWARKECDERAKADCAHIHAAGNVAVSLKPGDEYLVPLCRRHHTEQHNIGQPEFERRYAAELEGMTLAQKALEFSRASPDRAIREVAKEMGKA